jgi:hypothetical protein
MNRCGLQSLKNVVTFCHLIEVSRLVLSFTLALNNLTRTLADKRLETALIED